MPTTVIDRSMLATCAGEVVRALSKKLAPRDDRYAEELLELRGDDEQAGAGGEADDHGVRNEVDEPPEPRDAHRQLDEPDHQVEREHERDVLAGVGAASGATVANTTSDIALVGPETRCHDEPQSAATIAGHDRAVQPVLRRQPGERRVRDALRQHDQRADAPARSARKSRDRRADARQGTEGSLGSGR